MRRKLASACFCTAVSFYANLFGVPGMLAEERKRSDVGGKRWREMVFSSGDFSGYANRNARLIVGYIVAVSFRTIFFSHWGAPWDNDDLQAPVQNVFLVVSIRALGCREDKNYLIGTRK